MQLKASSMAKPSINIQLICGGNADNFEFQMPEGPGKFGVFRKVVSERKIHPEYRPGPMRSSHFYQTPTGERKFISCGQVFSNAVNSHVKSTPEGTPMKFHIILHKRPRQLGNCPLEMAHLDGAKPVSPDEPHDAGKQKPTIHCISCKASISSDAVRFRCAACAVLLCKECKQKNEFFNEMHSKDHPLIRMMKPGKFGQWLKYLAPSVNQFNLQHPDQAFTISVETSETNDKTFKEAFLREMRKFARDKARAHDWTQLVIKTLPEFRASVKHEGKKADKKETKQAQKEPKSTPEASSSDESKPVQPSKVSEKPKDRKGYQLVCLCCKNGVQKDALNFRCAACAILLCSQCKSEGKLSENDHPKNHVFIQIAKRGRYMKWLNFLSEKVCDFNREHPEKAWAMNTLASKAEKKGKGPLFMQMERISKDPTRGQEWTQFVTKCVAEFRKQDKKTEGKMAEDSTTSPTEAAAPTASKAPERPTSAGNNPCKLCSEPAVQGGPRFFCTLCNGFICKNCKKENKSSDAHSADDHPMVRCPNKPRPWFQFLAQKIEKFNKNHPETPWTVTAEIRNGPGGARKFRKELASQTLTSEERKQKWVKFLKRVSKAYNVQNRGKSGEKLQDSVEPTETSEAPSQQSVVPKIGPKDTGVMPRLKDYPCKVCGDSDPVIKGPVRFYCTLCVGFICRSCKRNGQSSEHHPEKGHPLVRVENRKDFRQFLAHLSHQISAWNAEFPEKSWNIQAEVTRGPAGADLFLSELKEASQLGVNHDQWVKFVRKSVRSFRKASKGKESDPEETLVENETKQETDGLKQRKRAKSGKKGSTAGSE